MLLLLWVCCKSNSTTEHCVASVHFICFTFISFVLRSFHLFYVHFICFNMILSPKTMWNYTIHWPFLKLIILVILKLSLYFLTFLQIMFCQLQFRFNTIPNTGISISFFKLIQSPVHFNHDSNTKVIRLVWIYFISVLLLFSLLWLDFIISCFCSLWFHILIIIIIIIIIFPSNPYWNV